jgi:hypothetical protein
MSPVNQNTARTNREGSTMQVNTRADATRTCGSAGQDLPIPFSAPRPLIPADALDIAGAEA